MTTPNFLDPRENPFGLADVGDNSAPTFADIDGDGDLDAFVGSTSGNISFFENIGDASNPRFSSGTTNPFGLTDVGFRSTPTFTDFDNDGDLDAFVGDSSGNISFFENIGDASNPTFAAPQTNPFGLTNVGINVAPTFADIDGDGDLDAFVGTYDGDIFYFENTTLNASYPSFANPQTNTSD